MSTATEVILGGPPNAAPTTYSGRIRPYSSSPMATWTRGHLFLPCGTAIAWIAYSDGIRANPALFQPDTHVTVTGHDLAGDLYLTSIRPATDAEIDNAGKQLANGSHHAAWDLTLHSGDYRQQTAMRILGATVDHTDQD